LVRGGMWCGRRVIQTGEQGGVVLNVHRESAPYGIMSLNAQSLMSLLLRSLDFRAKLHYTICV
jgi:hypothetical protein